MNTNMTQDIVNRRTKSSLKTELKEQQSQEDCKREDTQMGTTSTVTVHDNGVWGVMNV